MWASELLTSWDARPRRVTLSCSKENTYTAKMGSQHISTEENAILRGKPWFGRLMV